MNSDRNAIKPNSKQTTKNFNFPNNFCERGKALQKSALCWCRMRSSEHEHFKDLLSDFQQLVQFERNVEQYASWQRILINQKAKIDLSPQLSFEGISQTICSVSCERKLLNCENISSLQGAENTLVPIDIKSNYKPLSHLNSCLLLETHTHSALST